MLSIKHKRNMQKQASHKLWSTSCWRRWATRLVHSVFSFEYFKANRYQKSCSQMYRIQKAGAYILVLSSDTHPECGKSLTRVQWSKVHILRFSSSSSFSVVSLFLHVRRKCLVLIEPCLHDTDWWKEFESRGVT